ncbi:trna 5-methylaminomethyl-2-thiouridylate -methyltransferase [Holotrichia oblita]|nr:trna 5-methylaminomethyl-2-thiouridylate -methyltransferase [Holotrichia oblita]
MSGGVDSSVAAYILKEQGYNVIGLFMKNWQDDSESCSAEADYADVAKVCNTLDIPYYTVNFSKEYYEKVFEYFLLQYKKGRTPNPDVLCNREIKFGPFLEHALKLGADYIATGHYAGVEERKGLFYLKKAKDNNKDQTYFLNQLTQTQLSKVMFPLENIEKSQVREIAKKLKLSTAEKKDSTGICFIGERPFKEFLKKYIPAKTGKILTLDKKEIGTHDGVMYYTIGQRKGLNIGGVSGTSGRWFVIDKDVENNVLYVRQNEGEELFSKSLVAEGFNFIPKVPEKIEFECTGRFRYREPDKKINVKINSNKVYVEFENLERAVTLGQYAVLYDRVYCLGGGEIIAKA